MGSGSPIDSLASVGPIHQFFTSKKDSSVQIIQLRLYFRHENQMMEPTAITIQRYQIRKPESTQTA
jgi:hypothetical protein